MTTLSPIRSAVASLALLAAAVPAGAEEVETIIVPPGPGAFSLAANPATNKVYASTISSVAVIDGALNTATAIPGLQGSFGVPAVNPVTNRAYVPNFAGGNVAVIDGATNAFTFVTTGPDPTALAVNTVRNEIYVANSGNATVTVIEGATNATTNIPVTPAPAQVAVNEATNRAYIIAGGAMPGSSNMTVIDGATKGTTTVALGSSSQRAIAVNPVTNKVYVLLVGSVAVVDGATNAVQAVAVSPDSSTLLVNPATNRIYVGRTGSLTVIDGWTNATSTLPVALSAPIRMQLNTVNNTIYAGSFDSDKLFVIDGATHAFRSIPVGINQLHGQRYVAVNPATNTLYAAVDVAGGVAVIPIESRAVNLSTRAAVGVGNDRLIAGFIIQGTRPKNVVVRARGPSVPGLSAPLADPSLNLYSGQALIGQNDNWAQASNAAQLAASGFAPMNAGEPGILVTLDPGAYTAVVSGAGSTTGTAIVEVFEVGKSEEPFTNISTRAKVLTGEDVAIAGFVVEGGKPAKVLVRARGPSLAGAGLTGVLENPLLELRSAAGRIAINDDWAQATNRDEIEASGFAPSEPAESAILMTLAPGAYTAIMTSPSAGTGTAIIEVFVID